MELELACKNWSVVLKEKQLEAIMAPPSKCQKGEESGYARLSDVIVVSETALHMPNKALMPVQ